ncbi:MAG: hypothetical protein LBC88_01815 [Spirochaetaceae bacterium]|jgi:hypothetical protein|nr:hypothetical protein [Spirochaetaceae bacterium]
MPIQPIDLQTLFTQLDKVGKNEAAQKDGAQIQAAVQGARIQKKTDEKAHTVNETRDTGQGGVERIKDRKGGASSSGGGAGRQGNGRETPTPDASRAYIQDPDLGKNIDVSG